MECRELLKIVTTIGNKMLECGAEIYRVEESIVRMCKAYNAENIEVFAIPSSIIITLELNGEQFTQSKRVFPKDIDLDKVDKLNNLSRFICAVKPTGDKIESQLKAIDGNKVNAKWIVYICYAVVPFAFCLFFGGNLKDAAVSSGIGLVIKVILDILVKFRTNTVFVNIICSAVSSVIAILSVLIGIADNYDKIIIGTIMLLVPGIILTNSMRDFIMGDLMAGILRLIEAVLVATGIAIGVALVLSVFDMNSIGVRGNMRVYLEVLYSFVGSLGFAIVFNIKGRKILYAGIGGALSQFSYSMLSYFNLSDITKYLFATVVIAIYAEVMARFVKSPAIVFLVPAIIPLVPGGMMYYSMEYCIAGKTSLFTDKLLETLGVAGALAMGILLVSSANKILRVRAIRNKLRKQARKGNT